MIHHCIDRREILKGIATLGAAQQSLTLVQQPKRRVSQDELSDSIAAHSRWLSGEAKGRRAVFSGCDLSGLEIPGVDVVDLRRSDFCGSDLQGIRGSNIIFARSCFFRANLSWSHLVSPVFAYSDLTEATCNHCVWGWSDQHPEATGDDTCLDACFPGADLSESCFESARIRGSFLDTKVTAALLVNTDFRRSTFLHEVRFNRSQLSGASFREARLSNVHFKRAKYDTGVFAGAIIGPGVYDSNSKLMPCSQKIWDKFPSQI
jgi:uncharacterized protein YjbI with pentapeptide repeats